MFEANNSRYSQMIFQRCSRSGLKLPSLSLGLWHNFGGNADPDNMLTICHAAFDAGITHFDLANNYGPPYGSAEANFGRILKSGLGRYRDELVIATKAGYDMWPGPYGDGGSRKYLIASLDQSLKRMGLDYVDIFYHHRPDPETPIEETMAALDQVVRSGKALYAGISNYRRQDTETAANALARLGTPLLINQRKYSMFDRDIENDGLKSRAEDLGIGLIAFSPLAQGLLTDRYLAGIPEDSRMSSDGRFLKAAALTDATLLKILRLNSLADQRGQTLAQMALSWILRDREVASVLIGVSKTSQIMDNIKILNSPVFCNDELAAIDDILAGGGDPDVR